MSSAEIRRQLQRILSSATFAGSDRMCRFLRFAVERQLAGKPDELKEYTIGLEVFDRPATYDPRVDPIVRVEARRLRAKLRTYYETEGRQDTIIIDLPKGAYVPVCSSAAPALSPVQQRPTQTIAVLPFENAARGEEAEYLADGLTQQIIHRLTRVQGIRVVGWNSMVRLRERTDLRDVASDLNASTVLTGLVRSGGGRLRIGAQLAEPATGTFLWSEFYDRPMEDLFAIEEEIAGAIVDALHVQLGLSRASTVSAEAYKLYFQGRYHWNRRTFEAFRRAIELFRQALDLDPSFALAWAALADTYVLIPTHAGSDRNEMVELARHAAERALGLAPTLGEAETSLAFIRATYDWQWQDAEDHYRRAMLLSPSHATAFHWYGSDYCAIRGRFDEAHVAVRTANELDPLSAIIREGIGYTYMLQRDYRRALAEYERVIELDPGFIRARTSVGRALIQLGDYRGAIASLEIARDGLGGDSFIVYGALGQACALVGERQRALEYLGVLEDHARQGHSVAVACAAVHLGLGDKAAALTWIRRGFDAHEASVAGLGVHPLFDPLRNEPVFQDMVDRLGSMR